MQKTGNYLKALNKMKIPHFSPGKKPTKKKVRIKNKKQEKNGDNLMVIPTLCHCKKVNITRCLLLVFS